jgi:hypothetical protein
MRLIHLLALIVTLAAIAPAQSEKPQVFVSDSNSWQISGGFSASRGSGVGGFYGGARPQTAEIIKTFNQRCPRIVVTMDKSKAAPSRCGGFKSQSNGTVACDSHERVT